MNRHYSEKFSANGRNSQGVDWGDDEAAHQLRQIQMLIVFDFARPDKVKKSLLDVGCGYGHLADFAFDHRAELTYTGVGQLSSVVKRKVRKMPIATAHVQQTFFHLIWASKIKDYKHLDLS